MTTRLILLAAALLCWAAPLQGQTIKSLGFNTTNGRIVAATNVVWTNAFSFSTNTVAAQVRTNLGLGATNDVTFNNITIENDGSLTLSEEGEASVFVRNDDGDLGLYGDTGITAHKPIYFTNNNDAATTRANLGLPLPALTNTSNVTTMRALAGSTNTNQPVSGTVALSSGDDVIDLTFSNGILLNAEVQ
jgi:hypothetical protein